MSVMRRTPVDLGAVEHGIDHLETAGNFDAAAAVRHLREENFALARQLAGAVRERDTALVDRARLVAEVERLRSENEWLHRQVAGRQ
jgi:hypothetical protein